MKLLKSRHLCKWRLAGESKETYLPTENTASEAWPENGSMAWLSK